jgi:hypothetical protein
MMQKLRIALTIITIVIVYAIETYANLMVPEIGNGPQSYIQLQEWHRAMTTIRVSVPIAAIVILFAIWWEFIKQLWR